MNDRMTQQGSRTPQANNRKCTLGGGGGGERGGDDAEHAMTRYLCVRVCISQQQLHSKRSVLLSCSGTLGHLRRTLRRASEQRTLHSWRDGDRPACSAPHPPHCAVTVIHQLRPNCVYVCMGVCHPSVQQSATHQPAHRCRPFRPTWRPFSGQRRTPSHGGTVRPQYVPVMMSLKIFISEDGGRWCYKFTKNTDGPKVDRAGKDWVADDGG